LDGNNDISNEEAKLLARFDTSGSCRSPFWPQTGTQESELTLKSIHVTDFTLSPRTPATQTTSLVKEWHEFPPNSIELPDTSECMEQIPDIKVTVN
jgi:hypothetical protein